MSEISIPLCLMLLVIASIAGCNTVYDVGTTDGGIDGGRDSGPVRLDAGIDAGPEPMRDAGPDAPPPHTCGNGVVEFAELCDPPGTCPTSCADSNVCTVDRLHGSPATCDAVCQHAPAGCASGDGCCPTGCVFLRDQDCPAFFLDTDIAGTTYNADPDMDGDPADNEMFVQSVESCFSVTGITAWPRTVPIDVVARNLTDTTAVQVRLTFDPSLMEVSIFQHRIFNDGFVDVGFLNLPLELGTWARRDLVEAGDARPGTGYALYGATYVGMHTQFAGADHPHPPTALELYRADSVDGVPVVRVRVRLLAASDAQLVRIELTNEGSLANGFGTIDGTGGDVTVDLPPESLFHGTLAVNRPCP